MKIRKRKYPSGRVRWQLDLGKIDGHRKYLLFDTKEAAQGGLVAARAKRAAHGAAALSFTNSERLRFATARDRLAEVSATIEQAVEFFLMNRPESVREPLALADLLNRCLEQKAALGKAIRYLQQLKCSCLSFVRGREALLAHEITRAEVEKWVLGNGWKPKTQRVYLGDLRTLFAFAVSKGHAVKNPCEGDERGRIELATLETAPIQTLSLPDVKQLLTRAALAPSNDTEEDFRPLLMYAALGIFCGIRPAELGRMDRRQVSLSEHHASIESHQAKTRRRRVVDISANAVEWIRLDTGGSAGPITEANFRKRWERLRKAAGLGLSTDGRWTHDAMRHTFASMHYAHHQNESLLKAQMGHSSNEDVLFRHYRALKTRAEAAAFWALTPAPVQ